MTAELGIPNAPPPPCHDVPTFGCSSCIERDRLSWCKTKYESWKAAYKPPKCEGCSGPTTPYDWSFDGKALVAEVGCIKFDADEGVIPCSNFDFEVLIA